MAAETGLSKTEIVECRQLFDELDADGNGTITAEELEVILKKVGMYKTHEHTLELIAQVDQNNSGTVDFDEFLLVVQASKDGGGGGFAKVVKEAKKLIKVQGASGMHSFAQEELAAFAKHMNQSMANDPDVAHLLPIDPDTDDLCRKVHDGILLCKFINLAVADTIDTRALNKKKGDKKLSLFQVNENQSLCISAAKSIGVVVTNVGAAELREGEKYPHLVLGIVWQLVRISLLNSINLKNHPELVRLLEDGEELSDLLALPPEQLLLRWFNYHLKNANHPRRVANFGPDVQDSECYTVLLNQISHGTCDKAALSTNDQSKRAEMVLANAQKLGVQAFIEPNDIVKGNRRLNLAFTAAIFNQCPGLEELTEEEAMDMAGLMDDDFGDSREERAFRMWINSLNVAGLYINNLFEDCKDGLALLKVMDKIEPGIVSWKSVEMKASNRFRKVSNANYAVVLGKQMKFSLVGVGGVDIVDGNRKLVLALVWQLMRYHTVKFLSELSSGGKHISDADIISWANEKAASTGRGNSMSSFKDASLVTSHFFFDVLSAIESRIIDWDLVTPGETEEDRMLNARYAISVARKLGATIFILPEDITEVKPKMIMTFVASLMAVAKAGN